MNVISASTRQNGKQHLTFRLPLGIYPFDVLVHFGTNKKPMWEALGEYISKEDLDYAKNLNWNVVGKSIMLPGRQQILYIHNLDMNPNTMGYLAHEVFHVAHFIMEKIGMGKLTRNNDEAYAYLIGYITEKIHDKLKMYFSKNK